MAASVHDNTSKHAAPSGIPAAFARTPTIPRESRECRPDEFTQPAIAARYLGNVSACNFLGIRFFQTRAAEIDKALAGLALQANNIANDLDEKIQGTAQLQFGLARAVDLDSSNKAECSAFLSAVLKEYPQYTGILTILPDGSLFCDSLQSGRKLDLRDREYFQKALVTKDAVTLQPVIGRLTGISVLQIAYPARSVSGQLKYVLLASFNLQKFWYVS